jgi:hypothetical protein
MQRSGTPDARNPNKRNNIFLWADGWEQCVIAFNYLPECDPTFHSKVRHAQVEYDYKGTRSLYVERDKMTNLKFLMWVNKIDCELVNDRMNQNARLLIEYVKKEKCVPSRSVEYKDVKIGRLWQKMKTNGPNHDLYKSTLASIALLHKDMERYLSDRETKISPEDKVRLLIEYVNKEKCVPSRLVEYKDVKIGSFWHNKKTRGPNHDLYKSTLASIALLRKDMEHYLSDRETKISPEDKARLLIEYVKKEKCVPSRLVEYKDVKIGSFWHNNKTNGPNHDLYKSTLASIALLREDIRGVIFQTEKQNFSRR